MAGGKLAMSYGGIKYPMQVAIVEAGFDLRIMKLVIPVEIYDENPKTYLEFTTSELSESSELLVLFRLKMDSYWHHVVDSDDRNR